MTNDVSSLPFIVLPSNPNIEKGTNTREAAKGAFSDGARDALALAVKQRKAYVLMDKWRMEILYREDHVYIRASNGAALPCGVFYYDTLKMRSAK